MHSALPDGFRPAVADPDDLHNRTGGDGDRRDRDHDRENYGDSSRHRIEVHEPPECRYHCHTDRPIDHLITQLPVMRNLWATAAER